MDERLESSWCLVYYQVSGEPGIAHCSRRLNNYLRECGSLFTNHPHVILFFACLIFAVGLNHKIILTAKFFRSTVDIHTVRVGTHAPAAYSDVTANKAAVFVQ